jgi:hypothetical protein
MKSVRFGLQPQPFIEEQAVDHGAPWAGCEVPLCPRATTPKVTSSKNAGRRQKRQESFQDRYSRRMTRPSPTHRASVPIQKWSVDSTPRSVARATGDCPHSNRRDLIASRNRNGSGRIYTIAVRCSDQAGHSSSRSTTVMVPHDMGK